MHERGHALRVRRLGAEATKTSGGTTTTYTFDLSGLLAKLVAGSTTNTYTYDALGRRVKAVEGTTTTYFAYGGPNVLYTRVGSTATDYVYASGLLVLRKSGTSVRYVHADHLGNVRLVTYWQSNDVRTEFGARYKPFGEAVVLTDNSAVKTRYTGEWLDASGLYYLRARYYDPAIGRFVSPNPALGHLSRPQSQNRYAYVTNNPLKYIDPSGQDEVPWWLDLLTLGLASQIPKTIEWWNRASDAERWGFIAGIVTAVAIGVAVGLSCVFAGCAGLWLLAAGSAAFLGGSVGASLAYVGVTRALGGTPTQEGLSHIFYWGGWAGAAGFGIGELAGARWWNKGPLVQYGGKSAPPRPGEQLPADLYRIGTKEGKWYSSRPFSSLRELEEELGPTYRSFSKSLYRITARTSGGEGFRVGPTSPAGVLQFKFNVGPAGMSAGFCSLSPAAVTAVQFVSGGISYYVY